MPYMYMYLSPLQGVGLSLNDPFEMFRKNMSYTYNRRERSGECSLQVAHGSYKEMFVFVSFGYRRSFSFFFFF